MSARKPNLELGRQRKCFALRGYQTIVVAATRSDNKTRTVSNGRFSGMFVESTQKLGIPSVEEACPACAWLPLPTGNLLPRAADLYKQLQVDVSSVLPGGAGEC